MTWVTTSTLLLRLRDFEDLAWQDFVERFRPPILDFARRLHLPAAECEDVAQETLLAFAQAYRDGKYIREKGRLRDWLFGIAYRKILDQRRRRGRRRELGGEALEAAALSPEDAAATDLWERSWSTFALAQCLRQLECEFHPGTLRAFAMLVDEERPPEEVAAALGVAVRTVYNAKHRVLKRLRELHAELDATAGP